ncbi:N-6 DNA methylase [Amycolatopsis keratiniphila]|uniref:N-6 DNA methylase n=1 Tax=Amycolatopsis keratiniphila TaxID=129921 RepID=UPI00087DB424|nr:N-6 DNA methylase [Amycolatopsis keratiniphila]OLZ51894.1 hypothetical protein BS330_24955 [Amycolatopsis keratiniphila subsp. nogabecina]SDU62190.1 Type I restriction-modification system, DNA methylase subunit [Amycolatopsis keratiniphila]
MVGSGTVSATGIAKIAGVGRAAVSNWRRRYADFPPPVGGTPTSPAFDLAAVENWLREQGKLPEITPEERVWRLVDAIGMVEGICLAGVVLFVRPRGAAESSPRDLIDALAAQDEGAADLLGPALPGEWSSQQHDLLEAIDDLSPDSDPQSVFEYLYARYVAARGLSADLATPLPLAQLMIDLAGPGLRVIDFVCGTGTLLVAAAERAGRDQAPLQCFGQDISPDAARITQLRLLLAGAEQPVVHGGDSLLDDAFPALAADIAVANPPFGLHGWGHEQLAYDSRWMFGGLPPRTEPELAWVQHALAHLRPGGAAVLLMPPAAAMRPAGRRIRGELLRRGALQAVIALAPGLVPSTSVALHLWLLRRPAPEQRGAGHVLFVDTAVNRDHGAVDMAAIADTALSAWREFEAEPTAVEEVPGVRRVVPVIDLLDEETDLSPQRHLPLPRAPRQGPEEMVATRAAFIRQLDDLRVGTPSVVESSPLAEASFVTLDDLAKNEHLLIVRAGARSHANAEGSPAVTGGDVVQGAPPSGVVPRSRGSAAGEIRAGDVLIPQVGEAVVARVATSEQIGAQVGSTVVLVRVDTDVLDPWFVAGALSTAENNRTAATSSATMAGTMRVNVKRLRVPVLPLAAQRRSGEAFRRLADFERALAEVAEQGRSLAREFAEGLAAGVLAPDTDSITSGNTGTH